MSEIAKDTGKFCFGIRDTLHALEMSAVETLIVNEELDIMRYEVKNPTTGDKSILNLLKEQQKDSKYFKDLESGVTLDIVEEMEFLEWLTQNYKQYGCNLQFVTDRSQEGMQFMKGFGGIGGILRWQVDFSELEEWMNQGQDDDWI